MAPITLPTPTSPYPPQLRLLDSKADKSNTYTKGDVDTNISNLIGAAPEVLSTLKELAAALSNDANYATTVQNQFAAKAPLASPTFTGTVSGTTKSMVGLSNVDNTADANKPISSATQDALNANTQRHHININNHSELVCQSGRFQYILFDGKTVLLLLLSVPARSGFTSQTMVKIIMASYRTVVRGFWLSYQHNTHCFFRY